jgi:hypothetical protein
LSYNAHIALWSGPRNISTALMYSFAQRIDTRVFDEPLYGYFLKHTGVARPDREETMQLMDCNASSVIESVFNSGHKPPITFTKNIACHLIDLDWNFLLDCKNVILIREPEPVLNSYTKQIKSPTILDLAYEIQHEVFDFLANHQLPALVVDSKSILQNPELALKALCDALEIPMDKNMLQWTAGARSEDGPWAKYWYDSVHRSTGFESYQPKNIQLPVSLQPLADQCREHYDYLLKFALKP